MIGYKQFVNEVKKNPKESILSWKSSHAELRLTPPQISEELFGRGKTTTNKLGQIHDKIHDHPQIKPQAITKDHEIAIKHYTETQSENKAGHSSSHNINSYLRNRADSNPSPSSQVAHHDPKDVERSVKILSSAFTPENTNREHFLTYTGVPPSIGHQLMKSKPGDKHTFAGFTSTSTKKGVAHHFAENALYDDPETSVYNDSSSQFERPHVIVCHCEPGSCLSVAGHSTVNEDEALLHHGAHVTYQKTTTRTDEFGDSYRYHHVTVHPTHKPLEEYGPYKGK